MILERKKKPLSLKFRLSQAENERKEQEEIENKKKQKAEEFRLSLKDYYEPMFPPERILVREFSNYKSPDIKIKQYLDIKVQRYDDEECAPNVYVQLYQESDMFTGYLKGKEINFPLDQIYNVIDTLSDLIEECDKREIEY